MKAFFITGTDTGVGKTLVAGSLAAALCRGGRSVAVMKPCESGCAPGDGGLVPADALFLKRMAGSADPLDSICPYRLRAALAPGVAAEREQVAIDPDHICRLFASLCAGRDFAFAEGAGGLLVPLAGRLLCSDLAGMLGAPLIVVGRLHLGAINHMLLTLREAGRAGLEVAGFILNETEPERGLAEETNPAIIGRFTDVPLLGIMPHVPPRHRAQPGELAALARRHLSGFFSRFDAAGARRDLTGC
jgi:dethiobiotin synthetase